MNSMAFSSRGNRVNRGMAIWSTFVLLVACSMGCGREQSGQSVEGDGGMRGAAVSEPSPLQVLEVVTDNEHRGAFVSLERNRIILVNSESTKRGDFIGTNLIADFWFEPEDFQIQGLTKEMKQVFHVGADTFVASVVGLGFDELTSAPDSVHWSSELRHLKPGTVFLAKSSSGFVYKVLLQECTPKKMVISYLKLEE